MALEELLESLMGFRLLVEMLEEHGKRNAEVAKNGCLALLLYFAINADNRKRTAEKLWILLWMDHDWRSRRWV